MAILAVSLWTWVAAGLVSGILYLKVSPTFYSDQDMFSDQGMPKLERAMDIVRVVQQTAWAAAVSALAITAGLGLMAWAKDRS